MSESERPHERRRVVRTVYDAERIFYEGDELDVIFIPLVREVLGLENQSESERTTGNHRKSR